MYDLISSLPLCSKVDSTYAQCTEEETEAHIGNVKTTQYLMVGQDPESIFVICKPLNHLPKLHRKLHILVQVLLLLYSWVTGNQHVSGLQRWTHNW